MLIKKLVQLKKSFFFLPIISFLPVSFLVSCSSILDSASQVISLNDSSPSESFPKIDFKIDTFEQSPLEDIKNSQTTYFKEIAKFLDHSYQWTQEDKDRYQGLAYSLPPKENTFTSLDATIVRWNDGDTPTISLNYPGWPKTINVRIKDIDTPEKGKKEGNRYTKTSGLEYEYATKATEFAEKLIPVNSKVTFVFSGQHKKSYERFVGSILIGHDGIYRNYSVESNQAGLSVTTGDYRKVSDKTSTEFYWGLAQSAVIENAINKQYGFYKLLNSDTSTKNILQMMADVFQTRGTGNLLTFIKTPETKDENIIDYFNWLKQNK